MLPPVVPVGRKRPWHPDRLGWVVVHDGIEHRLVDAAEPAAWSATDGPEDRTDLCGKELIDRFQFGRFGLLVIETPIPEQAAELADRVVVLVDTQVDPAIVPTTEPSLVADDQERR